MRYLAFEKFWGVVHLFCSLFSIAANSFTVYHSRKQTVSMRVIFTIMGITNMLNSISAVYSGAFLIAGRPWQWGYDNSYGKLVCNLSGKNNATYVRFSTIIIYGMTLFNVRSIANRFDQSNIAPIDKFSCIINSNLKGILLII